ncbi:hypothetical protein LTR91_019421 [Friedmanniomyces endolithicus]|uniref:Centrosomin N-terminal motif 1 domain-containing protein n=1 Tax=Friedmanniomyces endolithicus TaxID=329885 RepID=A0AAN6HDW6_9PEZI|nr:hypothetical protein LTR35_013830 [Friedmanniomyces endolithicus]KAK0277072.1 hypothetical protein LTS00_014348 [Friedmanniomyces endolithicus]KAK0962541.1 hypothetical protein LTR91_019421 [Friedmanniomyces endolithicus]KAK0984327.1 hypothetical protein LTS01_010774 [Friedmanniomyces endolithicus]KAK1042348.1 hypothetical protein LTS16_008956 [Friedmanniomyces endolithicus]
MDSSAAPYSNSGYAPLPASQLLQERLQERRAKNMRPKRARQTDIGPRRGADDDIFLNEAEESRQAAARMYDSSPLMAGSRVSSTTTHRSGKRHSVSVRDADDQLDRLGKQNFALKMELDHRRDHTVKLQEQLDAMSAQVERAEVLSEEHAELLRINSDLVEELEKRDKAVEEAMDIICEHEEKIQYLEEKMSDVEERRSHTRPSTANADSGYAGTEANERAPPSSPPERISVPKTPTMPTPMSPPATTAASDKLQGMMNRQTLAKLRREPSFMSQKKASTHALRSVYLEAAQKLHPVQSFNSLLSKRDSRLEEDMMPDAVLNSPRLSVLSESSFPSLYSPKKASSPEEYPWEAADHEDRLREGDGFSHSRQDSIKRVSRWMEEHEGVDETPSKSDYSTSMQTERGLAPLPARGIAGDAQFQSLNNALSGVSAADQVLQPTAYSPHQAKREQQRVRQLQQHPRPLSEGRTVFGQQLLPPTPDSASTRMLRASRSSIADEQSLLDVTPMAVKGHDPLEPGVRTAPKQMRSSIELNSAYYNYANYRDMLRGARPNDSSSEDEEKGHEDANADEDAPSATIKDLGDDYDGFPDGNSIIMGTPSRFLKHGQPKLPPTLFDPNDMSPTETASLPFRRRQSSAEVAISPPRKPSLSRAETSPTFLGTLGQILTNSSKSTVDSTIASPPRSFHSGTSSNRTVMRLTESEPRPGLIRSHSRVSRTSASPAQTLGQRTQKLFRRLSNSHAEPKFTLVSSTTAYETRSPREKSPLPTLTSTPSSAYVNTASKEVRRPSTGIAGESQYSSTSVAMAGQGRRPSLQARGKTEPGGRSDSVVAEKRNPFSRRGSARNDGVVHGEDSPTLSRYDDVQQDEREGGGGSSGARPGLPRRRGSIREAVAGRRPWQR